LRPDQVKLVARRLGVTEQDVVDMNRRLRGDVSLDAPIREAAGLPLRKTGIVQREGPSTRAPVPARICSQLFSGAGTRVRGLLRATDLPFRLTILPSGSLMQSARC
jgi:hypothetical protein